MLELTGFLGLTRISFFFAHTDPTDPTLLLCGWEISQMILRVGCARTDSTLLLGSHGSHRSHGVALWVGNLTDGSVGVGSWGLHGARSHGFIFRTLRTNQTYRILRTNQTYRTYRTNRTDWTFLKIIREICGICVRPRWTPWGRVTKLQKIVLFGGRFERFEKKVWKKLLH